MFVEFLFTAEIFPLTGSKKGIEEMLDIKFVRENPEKVRFYLKVRESSVMESIMASDSK